jgi:hypothetical protein
MGRTILDSRITVKRMAGRAASRALQPLTAFLTLAVLSSTSTSTLAWAANARRSTHPIFVNVPDAPQNDLAQQRFERAAQTFGLGPVEVVVVEAEANVPQGADRVERLNAGIKLVTKLEFARGLATLDEVATNVAATGGAGLDSRALGDLYFYRGWAMSRMDFNPEHVPEAGGRAQGYTDLVRAAMLDPHRTLNPKQYPPLLLEDWSRAVGDARERPQGTIVVRAAPEAFVTLDGGNPLRGPATFVGVPEGEHLIHVDEPTFSPWGATLTTRPETIDVAIPERRALTLPDAEAGARAKRMGMPYALVAEPRPGLGGLSLALRLVDTAGTRRDSAIAQIAGDDSALDAAVMRLDEQARRLVVSAELGSGLPGFGLPGSAPPPPAPTPPASDTDALPAPVLTTSANPRPTLRDDPAAWSRAHWPLVTAVGALVAATIVLSIGIAAAH